MPPAHFTPALFRFLRDLKKHNDREWFAANKARYEGDVREPALRFIRDFAPHLARISPHFVADDRKQGGSLFRIHRDVRFSGDKSPYKTAAGIHFRHRRAKDAHAPGFYLHLEPRNCFAGVGLWRPDAPTTHAVRRAIAADAAGWRAALADKKFVRHWDLDREDTLQRPPAGFPKDHPLVADLKLKSFVAVAALDEEDICAPGFVKAYAKLCAAAAPFGRFLTEAVGEAWD